MSFIDYYNVLQVSPHAHIEVIKSSYRTLMSKLNMHPDKGGDEERAKLINAAYEILSNEKLRADYDIQYNSQMSASINKSNGLSSSNNNKMSENSWGTTPMSDNEIHDLVHARLSKLVEFDNFKSELKDFIKKTKG
jgi:curved DNA-binding protein